MFIEIGGTHDGRHSTRANARSSLTFWPLLQQFSRIREGSPFGRH
ncbi:hypothetical protein SynMEDNS5_00963 [Synechococcus sp. MEDNS5]|nr:hypothetical protein SynMEDNS5_00963 [Synechococcus sp. MEDNS5]